MTAQRIRKHKYVEFRYSISDEDGNVLEQIDLPVSYVHCADNGILEKSVAFGNVAKEAALEGYIIPAEKLQEIAAK